MSALLTDAEANLWKRVQHRLRQTERWQVGIKLVLILSGALAGGVGGAMDGPLTGAQGTTIKGLLVVGGGGMAFVGGLLLLALERDVAELVDAAHTASSEARQFLVERDRLHESVKTIEAAAGTLDRKRRERLTAIEQMLETVEAALLERADAAQTASLMLRHAIHSVRKAMDYRGDDFFTVSIFQRRHEAGVEKLVRIAAEWSNPELAGQPGRDWLKGEGYSGVAWANAIGNSSAEVIEADTRLPHVRAKYPVPHRDDGREALYVSVAAIPILIGEHDEVWGVVTATSDRADVFRPDESTLEAQNVAVVRDVARFAGLLAGIDRPPQTPPMGERGGEPTSSRRWLSGRRQ